VLSGSFRTICRCSVLTLAPFPAAAHRTPRRVPPRRVPPSKYPPAKPGALGLEPLKAAGRARNVSPGSLRPFGQAPGQSLILHRASMCGANLQAWSSWSLPSCAWPLPGDPPRLGTSGNVKLLLPPRQSRGNSLWGLEGPLSTPDTSRCPSFRELLGSGRSVGLRQYKLAAGLRARSLVCSVRRPVPATHRDQGAGAGSPGSSNPGTVSCPQKIFGSRPCPRLEDSRSELPRRTECQHVVARDLGASPAKSKTVGNRGSISQ